MNKSTRKHGARSVPAQDRAALSETETNSEIDQPTECCPECEGDLETTTDEVACTECGLVVESDRIDHGPEWRAFDADEREQKQRVGMPVSWTLHDKGLQTQMGIGTDGQGHSIKNLEGRRGHQLRRIRKINRHSQRNGSERQLGYLLGEIARLCSELERADSFHERAAKLTHEAYNSDGHFVGHDLDAIAPALVYITSRLMDSPLIPSQLHDVSRAPPKRFWAAFAMLTRRFEYALKPQLPQEFLPGLISKLDVDRETERRAVAIVQIIEDEHPAMMSGKSPSAFAATCLWVASESLHPSKFDGILQTEVAEAADCTAVTIRNRAHDIKDAGIPAKLPDYLDDEEVI